VAIRVITRLTPPSDMFNACAMPRQRPALAAQFDNPLIPHM
jgi:hypothetical protein